MATGRRQCSGSSGRNRATTASTVGRASDFGPRANSRRSGETATRRRDAVMANSHNGKRRLPCGSAADFRMSGNAEPIRLAARSEEHTSELQSLMRSSYAVFCLKKKKKNKKNHTYHKINK